MCVWVCVCVGVRVRVCVPVCACTCDSEVINNKGNHTGCTLYVNTQPPLAHLEQFPC